MPIPHLSLHAALINPRRACAARVTVLGLCVLFSLANFNWLGGAVVLTNKARRRPLSVLAREPGGMPPRKFLHFRPPEIVSGAILG